MTPAGIDDDLHAALRCHREGRLADAEALYRRVLDRQPNHPEALRLFGVLANQAGHSDVALQLLSRSLAVNPVSLQAHIDLGNILQVRGDLPAAIRIFEEVVRQNPLVADGHYHLGNAWHAAGRVAEAVSAYVAAIRLDHKVPEAHSNLGVILQSQGRLPEARAEYEEAVRLAPAYLIAWNNLGSVRFRLGQLDAAIEAYRVALQIDAGCAASWFGMGSALQECGQSMEGIAAYRRALEIRPDYADAWNNLGVALQSLGRFDEALAAVGEALRLKPDYVEAFNNLGNILKDSGRYDEAVAAYRQALSFDPGFADAYNNLATALHTLGDLDGAHDACREAIRLLPAHAPAHNNLGNILEDQGRADLAVEHYRISLSLNPRLPATFSNLLLCLCYDPESTAQSILEESRAWDRFFPAPPGVHRGTRSSRRDPEKKLRVGFVSADFFEHVAGYSFLPFFLHHDRERFDVFGFSNVLRPDAMTARFRAASAGWHEIVGVSDDAAAALVRECEIDILVDLAMHTDRNRLAIFARKPSPVQATYLGYCGTTGLSAIDFRLSDPYFDPPSTDLGCYSEETVRLGKCYWCYEPMGPTPEVNSLPATERGYPTFGCLNKFAKSSPAAQKVWIDILQSVPRSRLLLNVPVGTCREAVLDRFTRAGIAADRVEFTAKQRWEDYLRAWQRCDIALDPFPFGGGITTCDALYLGVPVVTLSGVTSVGRGGHSILNNLGLPELVADTPEHYLDIAVQLANDLPRLCSLRAGLRARMERSPLRDGLGFARDFQEALRQMWRSRC